MARDGLTCLAPDGVTYERTQNKRPKKGQTHHDVRVPWLNHKNVQLWKLQMSGAETFAVFRNAEICAVESTVSTDGRISTSVCLATGGEKGARIFCRVRRRGVFEADISLPED
jgi:hypothetical protein